MSQARPAPTSHLRLALFFITFFSIILIFFSSTRIEMTTEKSVIRPMIYPRLNKAKAHHVLADHLSHNSLSQLHEFLPVHINGGKIDIGLVNVDEEDEVERWKAAGLVHRVVFDRVAGDVTWERLFPEWIDQDEVHAKPKCPDIPMPMFDDYPDLDVVVVRAPCGNASAGRGARDVFRLQVHLVAAKLAARRSVLETAPTVVFVGPCPAMMEIFRCEDVVSKKEGLTVYRPDLRRLRQKTRLPVGSCELAVRLAKSGKKNGLKWVEYNQIREEEYDTTAKLLLDVGQATREAYATVLHSSDDYVCGAVALAQSIKRTNSTKPLILLADSFISTASRAALELAGWSIRTIRRIRSPFAKKYDYNEWNYSKLRLWQLSDYDKIIFIDSDFIVLRNLDSFFSSPQLTASSNDGVLFNSGIMLLEPSECMFKYLMEKKEKLISYNGGDQGFLNEVFTWWHRWPARLNRMKIFLGPAFDDYNKSRKFPADVYAIHYFGLKPWLCYRDYDCNWDRKGRHKFASDEAHRRWWEVYDELPEELKGVCGMTKERNAAVRKWRESSRRSGLAGSRWNKKIHDPRRYHFVS